MTETKTQSKKSVGQKIIPKRKLSKRGQGKDSVKSKYQPLDGQWGWMIVLGASLGHFFLVGLARTMGVFFVYWVDRFEGTAAATAWVQSLFNTVRMVIGPLVSMLCESYGARIVVICGGFVFGLGCVISAFATSLQYLYLSFSLLAGLGAGCLFTAMFVMVNKYFDKKKGIAMSLATVGSGLGTIVLAPLETLLLHEYGHYGAMLIIGGLMFNSMVVGALFRPLNSKLNWPRQKPEVAQEMHVIIGGDDEDMMDGEDVTCKASSEFDNNEETVSFTTHEENELNEEIDNVESSKPATVGVNKLGSNGDMNKNNSAQLDVDKDVSDIRKPSPSSSSKSNRSTRNIPIKRTASQVSQTEKHSMKRVPSQVSQGRHDALSSKKSSTSALHHRIEPEEPQSKCAAFKAKFAFLKSVTFWVYSFYIAALPCVVQIYVVYIPSLMKERGFSDTQAALVISIAGASDIAGRFIAGFLFDLSFVRTRRWPVHTVYGFILGLVVLFNGFQHHLVGFIAMALVWGIFEGGYHSQRATIVSEFIKPQEVANSVGFMIFWQGIGNMLSPTFAGFLKDQYGTYATCFYYGGTTMMFCSVLFFFNYVIVICLRRKNQKGTNTKNPHI